MKKTTVLCQLLLLGMIGCSSESSQVAETSPTPAAVEAVAVETSQAPADAAPEATFVSLKVPNMH
ncbi:MAG: hypothetical protein AB8B91_00375 [Rubripirellula sp.]